MTIGAADFHAGDDVKGIAVTMLISPQAGAHLVVVGDSDDIQRPHAGDMPKYIPYTMETVAGGGMHMNIGTTGKSRMLMAHELTPCPLNTYSQDSPAT